MHQDYTKNSDTSQVTRQSTVGALFFAFGYRDNFGIYQGLTNNILQLVCHKIIIISVNFYDGCGRLLLFHIGTIYYVIFILI